MAGLPQPRGRYVDARTIPTDSTTVVSSAQRSARPRACLVVGVVCCLGMISGAGRAEPISRATNSRAAREESIRSLPFDQLTPEAREKISAVVGKPTLFRRMPLSLTYCDPLLHQFLIRNPEIVVNIWQLMGITKVSLQRTDEFAFRAADGMGTVADVELVFGDQDTHLYYCRGSYEGPLYPKRVTGNCVLLLETGVAAQEDGTHQIVDRLDVFLNVDNAGVDMLTRTLQPLVTRSADQNFLETTRFVERIWRTAEKHGPGMRNLSARLDQVSVERREQFARLSNTIHSGAQSRPQPSPLAGPPGPSDPGRFTTQMRR